MTICCKVCALLHKLALLAVTPIIFYSLASFHLGCVSESYGLLVNLRACPRGLPISWEKNLFQTCGQFGKSSKTALFSSRLVGVLNWLVGLFSVKYL